MKYPYIVKKNGIWYPAGTDVPEDTTPVNSSNKYSVYTKTDILRMPISDLKTLAREKGIENAGEMTGAILKKELLKILGL